MKTLLCSSLLALFLSCDNAKRDNTINSEEEMTRSGNAGKDTSYPPVANPDSGSD